MENKRLPPDQKLINKFPILQAGSIPYSLNKNNWSLEIYGEVENPTNFTYQEFIRLPTVKIKVDIHCVTGWSLFDTEWEGVQFKTLFKIVKPKQEAKFVIFECADLNGNFTTSLPIIELMNEETILAFKLNGEDLPIEHGGPVRSVVPKKYFYKSAKWVQKLKITKTDELGFWERNGYSNTADPWKNDRYSIE
ncbi:MAG: sulfite oxidase-like oxidoreductase [Candidatus Helarchaeota archaeon]